jgi:hypothetical protein
LLLQAREEASQASQQPILFSRQNTITSHVTRNDEKKGYLREVHIFVHMCAVHKNLHFFWTQYCGVEGIGMMMMPTTTSDDDDAYYYYYYYVT